MIISMTGYGKGAAESKKYIAEVELKSVNSRYLEIYPKLPNHLMSKEYEIREILKSKVNRGKLSLIVSLKKKSTNNLALDFNRNNVKAVVDFLNDIKKAAKLESKPALSDVLLFKDVLTDVDSKLAEEEFALVTKALNKAIANFNKMRKDEGKELTTDLLNRIKLIENELNEIQEQTANSVKEHYDKLKLRLDNILANVTIDEQRLAQELAIISDKSDITEETVRLKSHIKFFKKIIKQDKEPGRKLNFLCQELLRETNTISSKTLSTSVVHSAVRIKEEIEKIREQIQNIE